MIRNEKEIREFFFDNVDYDKIVFLDLLASFVETPNAKNYQKLVDKMLSYQGTFNEFQQLNEQLRSLYRDNK